MELRAARRGWQLLALRVTGAGLLIATGAMHLDLYVTGYRTIPTIGGLFLFQVITAIALGVVVLGSGSPLAAAAGALFALSTLGGYVLALRVGLFGFREVRTPAGVVAGLLEVAAFGALGLLALLARTQRRAARAPTWARRLAAGVEAARAGAQLAVGVTFAAALALLGLSLAATGPVATPSSGALLKVATIHRVRVLTNARGFTLYWFAPDTPTTSACYGTCAVYWPPLTGRPSAGAGVTGRLGTITRSGGTTQATYNGHPLYTYIGDSAPGQDTGNRINLNGGFWYAVSASS